MRIDEKLESYLTEAKEIKVQASLDKDGDKTIDKALQMMQREWDVDEYGLEEIIESDGGIEIKNAKIKLGSRGKWVLTGTIKV